MLITVHQGWPKPYICSAYTVFLSGKPPNIRSYTVYINGPGQPYSCKGVLMSHRSCKGAHALNWVRIAEWMHWVRIAEGMHWVRICRVAHLHV